MAARQKQTTGATLSRLAVLMGVSQNEDEPEDVREAAAKEAYRIYGGEAGINHFKVAERMEQRAQAGMWN